MTRQILAVLFGAAAALAVVVVIEAVGHSIYPLPADMSFTDLAQVGDYIRHAPTAIFLFVLVAWFLAVIVGGMIAAIIARKALFVLIIGGLIFLACAANLYVLPHPAWFRTSSVIVLIAAMFIAKRLARALFRPM